MRKLKSKNLSHRITINCKSDLYNNLMILKANSHMKSLSKTIDILLKDELNNRPPIKQKTLNKIRENLPKLCEKVGALDRNIMGACNNLNQLAFKTNIKNLQGKVINGNDFMHQQGIKVNQLSNCLIKYYKAIEEIRKEMNQIWQSLM